MNINITPKKCRLSNITRNEQDDRIDIITKEYIVSLERI